jgi:hypothetical protein
MVQAGGPGIKGEIAAPIQAGRTDDLAAALIRAGSAGTMVVPTGRTEDDCGSVGSSLKRSLGMACLWPHPQALRA